MLASLALLVSPLALPGPVQTSPTPFARVNFSVREGVPASSIRDLCYDADGFLVMATTGGLSRYDGQTFQHYLAAETPGLSGDRILSLHTDSQGRTWIGTHFAGPSVLEHGQFRSICDGQTLNFVEQTFEDSTGTIWLAGNRLGQYDDETLTVLGAAEGLPDCPISRIAEDAQGRIWLATHDGLYRGGKSGFQCIHDRGCKWVLTDFEGDIWELEPGGDLIKCSGDPEPTIRLEEDEIRDELDRGSQQKLLTGTHGIVSLGPRRADGSGLTLRRVQWNDPSAGSLRVVNCLLEGPGQDLWAGTALYGLDYLERRYVSMIDLGEGRVGPNLFQVHPAHAGSAIVEQSGSVKSCLVDASGKVTQIESPAGWDARAVDTAITDAGVWAACLSGLAKLEGNRLTPIERWADRWGPLAVDSSGSVWMLDRGAIYCVVAGTRAESSPVGTTIEATDLSDTVFYRGQLWGARLGEVVRLNSDLGTWESVADLGGAKTRSMRAGEAGELWVASYGAGLFRVNADDSVDHWNRQVGLPDPFLGWIGPVDPDGDLWLNSNSGILKCSLASLDAVANGTARTLEARTFRSPECNGAAGAQLPGGVFALPTLEGLVLFDSKGVPPPSSPPMVSIALPMVDGKVQPDGETPSGQATLRFDFTAPIFPTASDAQLQTKLNGLEKEWVDAGDSRTVRYPGLRAGKYFLEVRARTPTSAWSTPARSQEILISPYWYDRGWARVSALSLAALAMGVLVRLRTRVLASRNRALSFEIEQRELAESHLRASEERFRRLFHTAPSAIVSWTPTGELLDHNSHALQLFPRMEPMGARSSPEDLFQDPGLGKAVLERVLREKTTVSTLAMTLAGTEEPKRCRWHLAPTLDEDGEVMNVIAVVIDLSRQDRDAKTVAHLRESLVRAEESERSRIARELHDDLSQRLAALALNAHLIDRSMTDKNGPDSEGVESLRSEIESIATDIHSLSRQLHPTVVDDLGLIAALRSECSQRYHLTEIDIALEIAADVANPPRKTALALFRIAQEAIRNAARHARASGLHVMLQVDQDDLVLEVRDDGQGMHPEDLGAGGIGMNSMRERARLAGGDVEIHSTPGKGTVVVARVPRHEEALERALASRWE